MTLAASVLAGDRLALARVLSLIENDTAEGRAALTDLFPYTGHAHLVGVTGAPGTGKSTLVNQLVRHIRQTPEQDIPPRVAVVAVDPSSPFTGGAILGDRVRMRDLTGDAGIFIRSMATRGSLGGLAKATADVVQVFDAAGYQVIFIETVGAGQSEVDIARLAHTTLVVEAPGLGDDIQAIKAGLLEIGDILVVNKADRPGVEETERALRGMLRLAKPASDRKAWVPPIHLTIATDGTGIAELINAITRHRAFLHQSGGWERRDQYRLQAELDAILRDALVARWRKTVSESRYQEVLYKLVERRLSPHQAVSLLLDGGESK
jgi:LAO/AO transport system kinase